MASPEVLNRQPFKAIYIVCFFVSILIRIPFWFLKFLLPAYRPRPTWTLKRSLITRGIQELLSIQINIARKKRDPLEEVLDSSLTDAKFVWVPPLHDTDDVKSTQFRSEIRRMAEITGAQFTKIAGYWLLKKGAEWSGENAKPDEKTVLHLHGGAFVFGTAHPSDITANLTRGLLEHTRTVERIFAVDYRLSASTPSGSVNPFPAAVLDALAGYHYLVHACGFSPANITVAGDSAGGNLAFALVRHLVEYGGPNGLPPPGRLLSVSGWFDLGASRRGPEASMTRNAPSDIFSTRPARGKSGEILGGRAIAAYRGALDEKEVRTNEYLSPASVECRLVRQDGTGVFVGFPETYVVAGWAERLLDDSLAVVGRMRADGVVVHEDLSPDALHDFLIFKWHEPERTEVLKRVAGWIDEK